MAGEENNNQEKIHNSTSPESDVPQETILKKVLVSDNLVEDVKKGLVELKQTIGEKADTIQDKAGDVVESAGKIYDEVSTEVAEIVDESKKGLVELKQEIGEKVDIVQDKAIELGNNALDGVSEVTKTTVNYWSARVDSILNRPKSVEANLKQGIPTINTEGNTPKKNRPILDEYKQKEKNEKKEQAEKFLKMDVEESSLDILNDTYNPTSEEDRKAIELFKNIKLDKIIEAHNKATSYNDYQDTFETYGKLTEDITKQYIGNEMKNYVQSKIKNGKGNNKLPIGILDPKKPFSNEDVNKLLEGSNPNFVMSPEFKRQLIEKGKARSKELVNKIGLFLRKEKGGEFDNITNDKKKYPNIGALLENKVFQNFIDEERKLFNKDVSFNDFKQEQIKGLRLKLAEHQKVDLVDPGLFYDVMFGDIGTKKSIFFKGENVPEEKRGFYIGGYKYKFDGIKNITGMSIDGENFVIKRKIGGIENSEITFSKKQFAEGLDDGIFKGYQKLYSTNGKPDIIIQRDIV